MLVETQKYQSLLQFSQDCNDFSVACQRRNGLLEAYKAEADKLIEHQSMRNVQINDELSSIKRKNNILYPFLGIAAGFLGGYFLIHK